MVYKAIGLMSGSSLDGLDIVYAHFQETAGKWSFEIMNADCYSYPPEWKEQLQNAIFLDAFTLHHKVDLIASHGHTTFHVPSSRMTAQLGDGAAIAAVTGLPVVSD